MYSVYSTAAKINPSNPTNPLQPGGAQTVLQMNFRSRIVPLFQFAVFYNGDLEMTSTPMMILGGRVHTNGNLYAQTTAANPAGAAPAGVTTYFNDKVTSAGVIYDRTDASFSYQGQPLTAPGTAAVRVLQSGDPITNIPAPVYFPDSYFRTRLLDGTSLTTPLSPTEIAAFNGQVKDGHAGATVLNPPEPGFLRKRNYFNNSIGKYYATADLRLEMVPDRDVTDKTTTPWTRNSAIIPVNFTSIQTGGTGTCTTTLPAAGSDPVSTYIDPTRMNASNLHCNVFTKGQLQSLRQPVMVLTNINQTNTALRDTVLPTTALPSPALGTESTILGRPPTFPALPAGLTAAVTGNAATQQKILRALQVALVSTPSTVSLDQLDTAFSDSNYTSNSGAVFNGSLSTFKTTFATLLNSISITTGSADYNALLSSSPNAIAALQGAWFLPAPVQRVENNNPAVQIAQNPRNSGFYDSREQRWITMLQTNIASLSVWNRDGLYVEAADTDLTTPYSTTAALKNVAFNSGAGANFTTGVAFARSPATGTFGLPSIGLGSSDTTEGGLVFHATVNDNLNGDGAIVAANDVTADATNPIYQKNPDGTNVLDKHGNPIVVDYPRIYPGGVSGNQSPFGFAFNGGNYLPGSLTIATDRAVYIQGDFNNNGAAQPANAVNVPDPNRLPASFMADTITILSNQCMSGQSVAGAARTPTNYLNTPGGQIDCGIPSLLVGGASTVNAGIYHYIVTAPTAVNAAFLSGIMPSCGNLGRLACPAGVTRYSGGLNNYYRLLEGWTSDDGSSQQFFNYRGSFVSSGSALEYSGQWIPGSPNGYAHVPSRNFNFDTKFNGFSLLPPLTPTAIYLQQDVFKRAYN